jgi:type II secretory pathway component PulJ
MRNSPTFARDPNGFTLVELLIYILLLSVAMTTIYSVFISNVRAQRSQENTMEMVQDLRGTADVMIREIRMAGYDYTDAGGMGFAHDDGSPGDSYDTDANSIHFTMDINENGDHLDSNEDVNYYHDAATNKILRRVGNPGTRASNVLAEKISALSFAYFDAAGNALDLDATPADIAKIRTVRLIISGETAEIDPMTRKNRTRTLAVQIKVRNMGLN